MAEDGSGPIFDRNGKPYLAKDRINAQVSPPPSPLLAIFSLSVSVSPSRPVDLALSLTLSLLSALAPSIYLPLSLSCSCSLPLSLSLLLPLPLPLALSTSHSLYLSISRCPSPALALSPSSTPTPLHSPPLVIFPSFHALSHVSLYLSLFPPSPPLPHFLLAKDCIVECRVCLRTSRIVITWSLTNSRTHRARARRAVLAWAVAKS